MKRIVSVGAVVVAVGCLCAVAADQGSQRRGGWPFRSMPEPWNVQSNVLIIPPANLTFQWQRELKDKFRETFEIIRSDVLRANYGQNRVGRSSR